MKKISALVFGAAVLTGCCNRYDYYRGDVQYTQDGADCIYHSDERGRHFGNDVHKLNANKKIVYNDTSCAALYKKDIGGAPSRANRELAVKSIDSVSEYSEPKIETKIETKTESVDVRPVPVQRVDSAYVERPVIKRRYIIVPMQ